MSWIPLISSIISFIFALAVLDQFFARRKPHQLVWSLGLIFYGIATLCEFLVEVNGLSESVYRLWYLTGAIFVAAYLGMGTVYLMATRRTAHTIMAVLALASIYALIRVVTAPVDLTLIDELSGKALPTSVRLITPVFNVFGTVALVGGAAISAWSFWRRGIHSYRVISSILIAVGAVLPALKGTLLRFDVANPEYILELLGIILIFLGFLRSREIISIFRIPLLGGCRRISDAAD